MAAPLFKKIGDAVMRYRLSLPDSGQEADLKLGLRDWPVSENDEAVIHIELGKVPDLKGLPLKSAIHRVVLAGGAPRVEGLGDGQVRAFRVVDQEPAAGTPLEPGGAVKIKLRGP